MATLPTSTNDSLYGGLGTNRITAIKQTILTRSWEVGNPMGPLLLTG